MSYLVPLRSLLRTVGLATDRCPVRDPSLYLGLKSTDRPRTEAGQRGKCSPGNLTVNSVRQSPVQSSSLVRTQLTSPTSYRVPASIVSRALFGLNPFAQTFSPFGLASETRKFGGLTQLSDTLATIPTGPSRDELKDFLDRVLRFGGPLCDTGNQELVDGC